MFSKPELLNHLFLPLRFRSKMRVPKLKKWLPDVWYERQRKCVDHYINYAGQIVKRVRRSDRTYNFYSDLIATGVEVTNVKTMIVRDPLGDPIMGKILGQLEDEVELSAYFKRSDNVWNGDLIIIELKSLEGELDRDVYEVVLIRTWLYEQETLRKFRLAPLRDGNLKKIYENESIDDNPPTFEGTAPGSVQMESANIMKHPGGFSDSYYGGFIENSEDTKIYPFPVKPAVIEEDTSEVLREEVGINSDEPKKEERNERYIESMPNPERVEVYSKKPIKPQKDPFKDPIY
jgi:hypothetical protein